MQKAQGGKGTAAPTGTDGKPLEYKKPQGMAYPTLEPPVIENENIKARSNTQPKPQKKNMAKSDSESEASSDESGDDEENSSSEVDSDEESD